MHVCYLIHHVYPANFSTAITEYTRKLVSQGIDVSVVVGRDSPNTPAHEVIDGVEVYRILTDTSTSISIEPSRFGYRALKKIEKIHQSTDIDVLHMRAFPNLGVIVSSPPWMNLPPTVIDVRGTAVRNKFTDWISRVGIRFQRYLADEVVVVDQTVADNIFRDTNDIHILPLGVDLGNFTPGTNAELRSSWGISDEDIVFGYTGNLHPPRQLHRLIEAFAMALKEVDNCNFVIVGDGAAQENLMEKANELGIESNVRFVGEVPFERVPEYLRAFDIGLAYVPDRPQYRDQPPLKTAEYLGTELPVLATDTNGNQRFVTDGENAIVVPDEISRYAEGIIRLSKKSKLRRQLKEHSRKSVQRYDYEYIVREDLLPLYESMTEGRRSFPSNN